MKNLLLRGVKRVRDATRKAERGQVVELERRNRRAVELTKTQSLRGPSAIFIFSTSPSKRCKFCCCAASNGFATQRGKRSEVKWRNSSAGIGAPLNSPKRNPLGDPQQFSLFRLHRRNDANFVVAQRQTGSRRNEERERTSVELEQASTRKDE
jgi:hypothetical protein